MKVRSLLGILFVIMLFLGVGGCNGSGGDSSDTSSSNDNSDSSDNNNNNDTNDDTEWDTTDTTPASSYTIDIDFDANTAQVSGGSALDITSAGATLVSTTDSTSITVQTTTYGITVTSTVAAVVTYNLSGTLNGTLTVESEDEYQLCLNGVTITADEGPALDLESDQKAYIVLAAGTTNTLEDSATRSDDMTEKATLYGKGPMVFSGSGTMNITGNYKDGIATKDYIHVQAGTLNITTGTTAKDAIHAVNAFIFDDGTLTIHANGTNEGDEGMGIKVVGDDDSSYGAGKGYVEINGGAITITSVGKGITANWDSDTDTGTYTAGNPDPYVEINGGTITITTTGSVYEYSSGGTTVSCAPEGIEGKSRVTISGGTIIVNATEDGINAGDAITISGGSLYVKSTGNDVDAFDSNGSITISGGVVVAVAPNGGTCNSFDKGDGGSDIFSITGGTIVGIGGVTCRLTSSACTQNVVVLGSLTSGRTMALVADDGTVALAFTIPQTYATMVLSSPAITTGTSYGIYTGGTATGDETFYGLFLGDLDYSGGSSSSSFTVSSRITQVGGSYF